MTAPGNKLNFNNRFLKNLFENYLIQHVSENTRVRGLNQASLLDLVISSSEVKISDIAWIGYWKEWSCNYYFKADYSKIRDDLDID